MFPTKRYTIQFHGHWLYRCDYHLIKNTLMKAMGRDTYIWLFDHVIGFLVYVLTLIHFPLVDGSGYLHPSFSFWPLVALTTLSRAREFDSLHLARNLPERWVSGIAPLASDFQVSYYGHIGNFTIRSGITVWYNVISRDLVWLILAVFLFNMRFT